MRNLSVSMRLYGCCCIFIGFIPVHVYADSGSMGQFETALNSFEVEGLTLGMKQSEADVILNSAGYKLKGKLEKRRYTFYKYIQRKDKKAYRVEIYTPPKNNKIGTLKIILSDLNGQQTLESVKQRTLKEFGKYEKACESSKTYIRCHNFTDTNKLLLEAQFVNKSIQYTLQNQPSAEARLLADQREKKQAEIKKAQEDMLKEEARLEEERKLKVKKEARLEEERKLKVKEEARLEEERKLKVKKEAKLEEERKLKIKEEARLEAEEEQRHAQFLKKKEIAGHPCTEYDVNNKKQAMACLQALESSRIKNDSILPSFWQEKGTCQDMQNALGENLQAMGFWKSAIDKRVPGCKMLAALHEEKFKDAVLATVLLHEDAHAQTGVQDCDRLASSPSDSGGKTDGVPFENIDARAAVEACRQAVQESSVPRLQYQYARSLHKAGRFQEAVKWYRMAADQGNASAQDSLGTLYLDGQGVAKSGAEAVKWFRMAADQGHAQSQLALGWIYLNGRGVAKSDTESVKWYRTAADQGNASGQLSLGWMYLNGRGVEKSGTEALKWYLKAAEQGHSDAPLLVAQLYSKGELTESKVEVVKWLRKAAEREFPDGQFMLGKIYDPGLQIWHDENGVISKNDKVAVRWYLKAEKQGHELTSIDMGTIYYNIGTEYYRAKNYNEAVRWYLKAEKQGHELTSIDMGTMYYNIGTEYYRAKNYNEAVRWYLKAVGRGNEQAHITLANDKLWPFQNNSQNQDAWNDQQRQINQQNDRELGHAYFGTP